jgi:hypothetical protein
MEKKSVFTVDIVFRISDRVLQCQRDFFVMSQERRTIEKLNHPQQRSER